MMKALLQRMRQASVSVDGQIVNQIARGLLVYTGIGPADTIADAARLAQRVAGMRLFDDDAGKLNLSVLDIAGEVLAIPNFTLMADTNGGRRPSFSGAAPAAIAEPLFDAFVSSLQSAGCRVARGVFGASMLIAGQVDGPVNVIVNQPAEAVQPTTEIR